MKSLALIAATLAIPVGIASAQTPATSTTSNSQIPYIPLFSTGGASTSTSGTTGSSSAWYIDTARNLIVLCSQAAAGGTSTPSFTCEAQAVPTAATAGTSGAGTTGGGSSSGGAAGANPMGG